MKNKMKKFITGLCLGVTMLASGAMLTGCSSDIEFNQDDLNTAINNINEYVETQNNFSSEFAKNTLNSYLMKAMEDSANTTSFKIIAYETSINIVGYKRTREVGTYQYFTTDSMTKEMFVDGDSTIYRESVIGADNKYDTTEYCKSESTKTYKVTNDIGVDEIPSLTEISGMSNYSNSINFIIQMLDSVDFNDFIMETLDGDAIKFKAISSSNNGYIEIEFKDSKLVKLKAYSDKNANDGLVIDDITFEHNIADFSFDKTGYTLVNA